MIVLKELDLCKPLTDTQTEMLLALVERPVTPDEDCPELTATQLSMHQRGLRQPHSQEQTQLLAKYQAGE